MESEGIVGHRVTLQPAEVWVRLHEAYQLKVNYMFEYSTVTK